MSTTQDLLLSFATRGVLGTYASKGIEKLYKSVKRQTDTSQTIDVGSITESPYYAYAVLAAAAYQSRPTERLKTLRKIETNHGWHLNQQFSHNKTSVFHNHERKEVVISYRGTKRDKSVLDFIKGDLGTDVALTFGLEGLTKRFTTSEKHTMDVVEHYQQHYPDYTIIATGHSLGGSIARHIDAKHPDLFDEVHLFNPGTSVTQNTQLNDHTYSHNIVADPISMLGIDDQPNVYVYNNNDSFSHYLTNFVG